jgi:HK97 gp10 family phage protein
MHGGEVMPKGRQKSIEVTGVRETMDNLAALPAASQRRVLRPAITKAAQPVLKKSKELAPVGDGLTPDGRTRPHLKRTLKKTRAKTNKRNGSIVVVIGPEKNKAPHSHLVHDGTQSHKIVLRKPARLGRVVLPVGTKIQHPGAKPQPFMDDAGIAMRSTAQSILMSEIPKGIEKEAARLAKKAKGE